MAKEKYGSNRKYSGSQLAKISELRKNLDMGSASQDEVAKEAKRLGVKGFEEGGMAISDADIASVRRAFGSRGEGGNTLSDRDIETVRRILGNSGSIVKNNGSVKFNIDPESPSRRRARRRANEFANTISDRDIEIIKQSLGMEDGGEAVPAKFKGFSKLPEKVQQKMDPDLAEKYEKGGAVGSCRGMGAALRGGKFSGVK